MSHIAARIDRMPPTSMFRKILFLTGIGWAFDAMNQGMVSGVIAVLKTDWALTDSQLGFLTSIGMLGMALGAALSGMAADRWGRRTVIAFTIIIFGVASGLSSLAVNYPMFLVLRFLTGFGLGGELPAASTYISEYSPTKIRGRNVAILESFWAWGWIASALVAYLLIPVYGWRVAMLVGGIPTLYALFLYRAIPESPRYLELKGKLDKADALVRKMELQAGIDENTDISEKVIHNAKQEKVTFLSLWTIKYLRSTIVLWIIWFGVNFGYYGFVLWTPSLLISRGFDLVKSFEFTLIMCLAQLPGYFSAAYLVEKWGRKKVLSVYFLGTALAAWLFGQAGNTSDILLYGSLLYFFSLGAWGCVYAYTPEVYPTEARASGCGWAAAFGRLGAFTAPMVVPVVYGIYGKENGYAKVFILFTLVFAIVAVVVALFGKETMGKSLEEINIEMSQKKEDTV